MKITLTIFCAFILSLCVSSCGSEESYSLKLFPTSVSVAAEGESFTVSFTSNADIIIPSVKVSDNWLSLDSRSTTSLSFTAEANRSSSSRTATITIILMGTDLTGTVTVTQAAGDSSRYVSGSLNGYEYVDLGLSVKWATCNIGADSPGDYGNYYAWGETKTKSTYTSSNSVTCGVSMDDISGDAEYDAATVNWGSPWRIPTDTELTELIMSCTWTWTTLNSANCYEVTGTNGNSIFLPAAGYRSSSSLWSAGSYGSYWSSTPVTSDSSRAYCLSFDSSVGYRSGRTRYDGCSIRPVSE